MGRDWQMMPHKSAGSRSMGREGQTCCGCQGLQGRSAMPWLLRYAKFSHRKSGWEPLGALCAKDRVPRTWCGCGATTFCTALKQPELGGGTGIHCTHRLRPNNCRLCKATRICACPAHHVRGSNGCSGCRSGRRGRRRRGGFAILCLRAVGQPALSLGLGPCVVPAAGRLSAGFPMNRNACKSEGQEMHVRTRAAVHQPAPLYHTVALLYLWRFGFFSPGEETVRRRLSWWLRQVAR